MPDSRAAQALLLRTYVDTMQYGKAEEAYAQLGQRTARTAEDHLFAGYALMAPDPEQAVREISKALQLRNSPVARSMRSNALALLAVDTAEPATAEEAMRDADVAKALLPNEPEFLLTSVNARASAFAVFGSRGEADRQQQVLAEARRDAERAGSACYGGSRSAARARWGYDVLAGDDAGALREAQRRLVLKDNDAPLHVVQGLLRAGEIKAATDLTDQLFAEAEAGPYDPMLTFAFAERDPAHTRKLCQSLETGGSDLATFDAVPITLSFLGDNEGARAAARRIRERSPRWPWRHEWYRKLLDYDCGSLSADGLLELAGTSRLNRCEAHFHIGLTRLADGDRAGARQHFQLCADPAVTGIYPEWHWSRVFLARMDQDPQWPRWIAAKPNMAGGN
jgi:hypothetical protein